MINEWMGLSENGAQHGLMLDHMLGVVHGFMAVLFVGWTAFFLYVLFRFHRKRNPKADYHGNTSHFSTHAEIAVVIVEAILLLGLAFPLWGKQVRKFPTPEENPLVVRVVGEQFSWTVHYPGADGEFGDRSPDLVSASNPLGIDWNAANAKDDVWTKNDLHVQVGRPVVIYVTSKDVIHNFSIYTMRIAQDAIPGSEIPMWFTPIKTSPEDPGYWEVICAQLCGANHYAMRAFLYSHTQPDFEKWYAEADKNQVRVAK